MWICKEELFIQKDSQRGCVSGIFEIGLLNQVDQHVKPKPLQRGNKLISFIYCSEFGSED